MMNVSVVIDQPIFQTRLGWTHFWLTLVILGSLILCTIVGNVFVVAAILLEKHLQGVSNYLILSLAVADLMVATLPMPISAVSEVSLDWWL
ncbi:5-hydroxytryptamine receptor, partial [Clonorchis sinensis]